LIESKSKNINYQSPWMVSRTTPRKSWIYFKTQRIRKRKPRWTCPRNPQII